MFNWAGIPFLKEKPLSALSGLAGGATAFQVSSSGDKSMDATGGSIVEYTPDGNTWYRAHLFTASGSFVVNTAGTGDYKSVDVLVVAGGGGGGGGIGGGGGAGGIRTSEPGHPMANASAVSLGAGTYPITVGGGGAGGTPPNPGLASQGSPSGFGAPSAITAYGGGGGGGYVDPGPGTGGDGGSGGGGGRYGNPYNGTSPAGSGNTPPFSPAQGTDGGTGGATGSPVGNPNHSYAGGGGGGAASAGTNGWHPGTGSSGGGGPGGEAIITALTGTGAYFSGGGGGSANKQSNGPGGRPGDSGDSGGFAPTDWVFYDAGGIGSGSVEPWSYSGGGMNAFANAGGGGGGSAESPAPPAPTNGGSGGSGYVACRYQILEKDVNAASRGGQISYYGGKTIHVFKSSTTWVVPGSFSKTCEIICIGGGGASSTGGGGAGGYRNVSLPVSGPQTYTVSVGGGGFGKQTYPPGAPSYICPPAGSGSAIVFATGGGRGGGGNSGAYGGQPGGSGGGGAQGGDTGGSTVASPDGVSPTVQGYAGYTTSPTNGGGGGGAAGAGGVCQGGDGVQLPTTFQNPAVPLGATGNNSPFHPNPQTSGWWVCGGGSGQAPPVGYGSPMPGCGGQGGGGNGNPNVVIDFGKHGRMGCGAGGGGGAQFAPDHGGNGGSGLILIAYPT